MGTYRYRCMECGRDVEESRDDWHAPPTKFKAMCGPCAKAIMLDFLGGRSVAEHYTRNTLECTAWCGKCQRNTQHRVDGGRRGPCIDPKHPVSQFTKAQMARRKKQEEEMQNLRLF